MALLSDSQAEFTKDIIDQLSEKDLDNLLKVLGAETQEKPTCTRLSYVASSFTFYLYFQIFGQHRPVC